MARPATLIRLLGALCALSALSCAPQAPGAQLPGPGPAGRQRLPIVNGTTDSAHPAVVEIYYGNGSSCTGELIGPRTVLTAGHCADNAEINPNNQSLCTSNCGWGDFYIAVLFGTTDQDAFSNNKYILVDAYQHHPNYNQNQNGDPWNDIGIMHLADSVMIDGSAEPALMELNRKALETVSLNPTTFVGFGVTGYTNGQPNNDSGTKRTVTKHNVQVLNAGEIYEPLTTADNGLTCSGDSGGPGLLSYADGLGHTKEYVISVTSRGDQTCTQAGIDTRVDHYLDFISGFMGGNNSAGSGVHSFTSDLPSCGADGRCGFNCTTPDPDCPCAADGLCTTACPNVADDPDCPAQCAADGVCKPTGCPSPDPDCLSDGQTCNANSLCLSHRCALVPGTASRICAEPCDQGQACPSGTTCQLDGQNNHSCLTCTFNCGTTSTTASSASASSSSGTTGAASTAGSTGGATTGAAGSTGSGGPGSTAAAGSTGGDSGSTGAAGTTGEPTTGGAGTTSSGGAGAGSTTGTTGTTGAKASSCQGCASAGPAELLGLLPLLTLARRRRR